MTGIIDILIEKYFPQGVSSEKRSDIQEFFLEKYITNTTSTIWIENWL